MTTTAGTPKRTLSIAAIFAAAAALGSVSAQQTLDLVSRASLRNTDMVQRPKGAKHTPVKTDSSWSQPADIQTPSVNIALVKLNDGASADDLSADGFDVQPLRGGFAVVCCPTSAEALRLAAHKGVRRCEFNRQRGLKMDNARAHSGIDDVHNGIGINSPFTGRGVITGIVDGGFDPNHVNFKDDDGNIRIGYFSTVEVPAVGDNLRITPYTPDQLPKFTTDDNTQTHGTHTLGIMAGSFNGEATVGVYTDHPEVSRRANPYYGVAPASTIYASSGASFDATIAYAIDGILEHRWYNAHETPIVINLSLGGNNGPHDGSGLLCQYIDIMSETEGAIFCISSGNEGDRPIALNKTFSQQDNTFSTFIRPYVYTDVRYGMVEMYSDTEQDFDVSVIIYNNKRKRIAKTFPLNNKQGQIQYICSGESYRQDESDIIDPTFAIAYDGYVGVGGMIDEESGRFYAAIDYYVENSDNNPADPNTTEAQYTLGFMVTGHDGQRVDCFCDGEFTALDSYGYDGFTDGSRNGSISDVATAKSAIAVGSYNTREWAANLDGNLLGYDGYFKMDEVTEFSSYGTLVDGRELPHLLAPGCTVVSSVSTPYYKNKNNGVSEQIMSVKYTDSNRDHYFSPMMGTSMASPVVAGTVALMLEADPTLDYKSARDILMGTATKDVSIDLIEDPVQAGAGKLNSYEALKETLRQASLPGIKPDDTGIIIQQNDGYISIFAAGSKLQADIYATDGRRIYSNKSNHDELTLDTSALTKGVYVLCVNQTLTQRIIIK